ncbi:hypothetical protein P6U16_25830 (plasmid) [Rhizobium sp. 32-5/1]|uniref:hypothetical protein n=1 Tax=Rhizobium sp. 32-5/1 TaxID=3019602 RepID=UPI00240D5688|nr:hypothetical protein [Rhizobium sp. 32-5/1]WEZ85491.1 hypothetical protein P6U16_25830 [Rhizobium sp. 32-5/1]
MRALTLVAVASIAKTSPVQAAPAENAQLADFSGTSQLLALLLGLFIVAVILEQALTALFQWRVFRRYFDGKALKFPVMFLVALAVVNIFGYDVFESTMKLATGATTPIPTDHKWTSYTLSALVLAGGSAGVYNLLVTLGFRQKPAALNAVPSIDITEAWVSVKVSGLPGVAKIWIEDATAAQPKALLDVIFLKGQVSKDNLRTFWGSFTAQGRRFPRYGGYRLKANNAYRLYLETENVADPKPFSKAPLRTVLVSTFTSIPRTYNLSE